MSKYVFNHRIYGTNHTVRTEIGNVGEHSEWKLMQATIMADTKLRQILTPSAYEAARIEDYWHDDEAKPNG